MNRDALTNLQADVLAYILTAYEQGGPLPTTRDVTVAFGWSSHHTSYGHMTALEKKGALRRARPGRSYGIVLTHPDVNAFLERKRRGA